MKLLFGNKLLMKYGCRISLLNKKYLKFSYTNKVSCTPKYFVGEANQSSILCHKKNIFFLGDRSFFIYFSIFFIKQSKNELCKGFFRVSAKKYKFLLDKLDKFNNIINLIVKSVKNWTYFSRTEKTCLKKLIELVLKFEIIHIYIHKIRFFFLYWA